MGELVQTFGKIGLLSFGGPAGQIALMHRILVDEKRWLSEPQFLHALNFCMLLPGPEAMQLATYSGWLLKGVRGGLLAGLLFVLPGFFVLLGLSILYITVGDVPIVDGLLFGLKAAVLAIVLEAMIKVAKRALNGRFAYAIAIAAFVAIAFLQVPFPLIIAAAGLLGVLRHRVFGAGPGNADDVVLAEPKVPFSSTLKTLAVWGALWLVPLALLLALFGRGQVFADQALYFSQTAIVTFGGAYAVLAYVAQQAVEFYGWLRPDEMLTGLGLAETTPGPLILVLVFVGFLGASRMSGLDPITGGILGGTTALFFTFVPCFLWIFVGAPYIERLRGVKWLAAALSAITAAVVGVIANLAVWFGLQVLFGETSTVDWGPFSLPSFDPAALDLAALAIAVAAGVALIRFHLNIFLVLGAAAAAGAIVTIG
ncbi:chromate efflux transporter [Rhizobium sp. EC-SD404]|uniref:chromate efflux transporter n=1 Tax=Rhizobium sp. EC-SD404 TaxID=2038389 RepID=UPI00125EF035|nr:chromate efflux transporter [Rhizobium sp. EC-SD404]